MSDIEQKALALLNEVRLERGFAPVVELHGSVLGCDEALCRAIEKHEAFRKEVSYAVGDTLFMVETHCDGEAVALVSNRLLKFIIAKPDPLVEAWKQQYPDDPLPEASCNAFRAALDARGLEIREKGND